MHLYPWAHVITWNNELIIISSFLKHLKHKSKNVQWHEQYLQTKFLKVACFFEAEVERIGAKVAAATLLEKFITNMQRERSEVGSTELLEV